MKAPTHKARPRIERKPAGEVFGEPEAEYRVLFESHPQATWVYDLETLKFLAVNNAAVKHYGYSHEEFLAMTIKDIHPPEDVPRLLRSLSIAGDGLKLAGQWRHKKRDGAEIEVEILFHKLTWKRRPSSLVLARDVTDQRRAETALQQAEQKYRSMFENAVVGMFQTAEDGRLLTANLALARIYGFDSLEDLMRGIDNINKVYVNPERRAEFLRLLGERGAVWGFEAQHYRTDGTPIWVLESARVVRESGRKLLYFEGSIQSITDHKRAEEALRQLSGRLLQLQDEERRRIARELHDSTAQDMAALVRNLHQINGSDGLDPRVRAIVSESVALAEKSTRDVRTLSYLLHPPLLDEVGLASALSWYVKGFTQRSGIQVELVVSTEYRRLPGEVERALFRIVQEGLTNVHRHSGSPSARIELVVDDDKVHLEVRDEGRGIAPETLRKFRTANAGLGVGVAGMRERVRQLGGHLDIESSGRGAIVRAILPLREVGREASSDSGGGRS